MCHTFAIAFVVLVLHSGVCEERFTMHTLLLGIAKVFKATAPSPRRRVCAELLSGAGSRPLLHKAFGEREGFQREATNMG